MLRKSWDGNHIVKTSEVLGSQFQILSLTRKPWFFKIVFSKEIKAKCSLFCGVVIWETIIFDKNYNLATLLSHSLVIYLYPGKFQIACCPKIAHN